MKQITIRSFAGLLSILLLCGGCGKSGPAPGFNQANLDRVTVGMSKTDVESILGQPKTTQQRQTLKFENGETKWDPEILYHYEDGNKSATITLKDDKVSAKDPQIQAAAGSPNK
jgi:outer membrane protein assembly factor BamE (lipoprotein component of BamABCDE complex)